MSNQLTRLLLRKCSLLVLPLFALTLLTAGTPVFAETPVTHTYTWIQNLDGIVRFGSPALGDVDNDGKMEIAVGTANRKVYLFRENGTLISGWPQTVSAGVGSAPAIGDITGDDVPEIIVTTGTGSDPSATKPGAGAIFAFASNGTKLWERQALKVSATGYPGGIFGSPVLADLTGDGVLDVLAASFDQRVYGYKGDGSPIRSNPNDASAPNSFFWLGDGSWATPAVGDIDSDGKLDIAVTAASNVYVRQFPPVPAWGGAVSACTTNNSADQPQRRSCGLVVVFDQDGNVKPGWPQFVPGHDYDASPAMADLDNDGKLEIITGSGDYWMPNTNPLSFYVTAWRSNGTILWRKTTSSFVKGASPAVGDIDGDGKPEVVVGSNDKLIYAYNGEDGSTVPGFPVALVDRYDRNLTANSPIVLADVSGDGVADIITAAGTSPRAIGGNGLYLASQLTLDTYYSIAGAAAIGDIDGDGKLEVIVGSAQTDVNNGRLYRWDLNVGATGKALPWAQFQGNNRHTGLFAEPGLRITPPSISLMFAGNTTKVFSVKVNDSMGSGVNWSASVPTGSAWISLDKTSGSTPDTLLVTINSGSAGLASIVGTANGTIRLSSESSTKDITVKLTKVDQLYEIALPLLH